MVEDEIPGNSSRDGSRNVTVGILTGVSVVVLLIGAIWFAKAPPSSPKVTTQLVHADGILRFGGHTDGPPSIAEATWFVRGCGEDIVLGAVDEKTTIKGIDGTLLTLDQFKRLRDRPVWVVAHINTINGSVERTVDAHVWSEEQSKR